MTITNTANPLTIAASDRAARLDAAGADWTDRIAADPSRAQLTYRVRGAGEGAVSSRITAGKHEFLIDEPSALAGDDHAASPVEVAPAALLPCQVVV